MNASRNPLSAASASLVSGYRGATLYIAFATACTTAGWGLSAFHALTAVPFLLLCAVTTAGLAYFFLRSERYPTGFSWRRFRRPLPLLFFILAVVVFIGGITHLPSNFDGLTYRTPRVLHWAAEHGWLWIQTPNIRMNTRPVAFEWMILPEIYLFHGDRLQFLINFWSLLLMPGQCFALFRRLGVRARTAATWMWILPMGLCYPLQAGGNSNTSFAVTFIMAAVLFAFKARESNRSRWLYCSLLAIGLTTGAKAVNIPLGLPWLIAALPALWMFRRQFLGIAVFGLWGLVVSIIPISVINQLECGDWTGMKAENSVCAVDSHKTAFLGNIWLLAMQNSQPPILPVAKQLTKQLAPYVPASLVSEFGNPEAFLFVEFQMEEGAGLGLGVMVLLLGSFLLSWRRHGAMPRGDPLAVGIVLGSWVALAAYMALSAIDTCARMTTPYYPLLAVALLWPRRQTAVTRSRFFLSLAILNAAATIALIAILPPRPLLPVPAIINALPARLKENPVIKRAQTVYDVYGSRGDSLQPIREVIPATEPVVGAIISPDAPETSLWRPFGSHRIVHVSQSATPNEIARQGIRYVIVSQVAVELKGKTISSWLQQNHLTPEASRTIHVKASQAPEEWIVVRVDKNPAPAQ